MYGLWLFKEIQTEYGHCKVDIYRKGYNGSQIEIGALAANSLTISLENLSEITAPVGKSVCSFEIIDTDQIAYDDFFTPDATYYKVVVSTKVGTGAYVTRWSGYITPDFFAENLTYRTPISISARDNIGYLNDVDFDLTASSITVREFIQSAFRKIAADYPMSLSFVSQKQTAEGILAIDATISTLLLKEMSWGEALETILHDLGLQMRWVDNNTIAVLDLSQIPEYYPTQAFNFIHSSGYREIAPAWRQLSQSQDYGLRENFFEGWMRSDNLTFIKSQTIQTPDEYYGHDVRYYTPNNWGVARDIYTTDPAFYNSSFGEKIIFSAVSKDNPSTTYMSWSADILTSNKPLTIKFKAMNSVLYPYGGIKPYPLQLRLYDPFLAFARTPGDYLQIGMRFNLFLHTKDNTTYVMREDWVEDNGTGGGEYLNFTLDKISLDSYQSQEGSGSFPIGTRPSEKELTITANTIPYDGVLELRIYGYYVADYKFGAENGTSVSHSPNFDKFFAYIDGVTYTFDNSDIPTGQDTAVQINELHNVKGSQDYTFGQVPFNYGGINAYAGGLFKADGNELVGFQRNADGANYNLLELIGREIIHFNKDNYNRLSGTIKNLDKEPLMFNRLFVREGKTYYPYNCSLNVISNKMNITAMQEVEPYETAVFNAIDSEIVTGGGATVGGGNNTILQYSEEAGNEKRIYELETATETEKKDAFVVIDNSGFNEAKRVHISELIDNKLFTFDEEKQEIRTKYNLIVEKAISFGGAGTSGSGGGLDVTAMWNALATVDNTKVIDSSHIPDLSGKYLPLSGGEIRSTTSLNPLNINSSSDACTYLVFKGADVQRSSVGYYNGLAYVGVDAPTSTARIGVTDDGTPQYWTAYNGAKYNLIHSGNIGSQSVNYASSASKLLTNSCEITYNDRTTLAQFKLTGDKGGYSGMLFRDIAKGLAAIDNGTECGLVVTNMRWLLHYHRTNDIVSIDAPLSLPNALKISSNTPNGSLDITDDYSSEWRRVFTALSPNMAVNQNYSLFFGKANNTHNGAVISYQHAGDGSAANKMWFGLHSADRLMSILANGNVLIGTTTDSGYKLDVNGTLRSKVVYVGDSSQSNILMQRPSYNYIWAEQKGGTIILGTQDVGTTSMHNASLWIQSTLVLPGARDNAVSLGSPSERWASVYSVKGNFTDTLIVGTTTDNGAKLQVNTGTDTILQGITTYAGLGIARFIAPNTLTGDTYGMVLDIGVASSNYNSGNIAFRYLGSGNRANYMSIGLYGNDNIFKVYGTGNVVIGTTSDNGYKLDVNGTLNAGATTLSSLSVDGNISQQSGNSAYLARTEVTSLYSGGNITCIGYLRAWGNLYVGASNDTQNLFIYGNLTSTGSITFGSASDRRLKDNIKSMTDEQATFVLKALNPVTYQWNSTAYELGKLSGVSDGFIADEYEKLIPNSGRDIWVNYRAINYERATSYLVKGWQNHETRLEKAERRIRELENELNQYRRAECGSKL